jgi:hypothetical protein
LPEFVGPSGSLLETVTGNGTLTLAALEGDVIENVGCLLETDEPEAAPHPATINILTASNDKVMTFALRILVRMRSLLFLPYLYIGLAAIALGTPTAFLVAALLVVAGPWGVEQAPGSLSRPAPAWQPGPRLGTSCF